MAKDYQVNLNQEYLKVRVDFNHLEHTICEETNYSDYNSEVKDIEKDAFKKQFDVKIGGIVLGA